MKLMHLADLHIGKNVNDFSLIEDQKYLFDQLLETARQQKVDAVLLAGDIYDRSVPSEEAVNLFDDFISAAHREGIQLLVISGNHDSDDRLNFGSRLFERQGIHICGKYQGQLNKVVLADHYGPVNFYLLPFVKASHVAHFFPQEDVTDYQSAVETVIRHADIDYDQRNVLLAHQFVSSSANLNASQFAGSESSLPENVGNVEVISKSVFEDFDYTALGHLHAPQQVGQPNIRYSGSPLKYSLSEIHNNKTVPIIELKEKGNLTIDLLPLKPLREMRHLHGPLKELLKKENISDADDYIYVTLTDETLIPNAIDKIRQFYPNVLKLDYDNSHTRALQQSAGVLRQSLSFREMIADFYRLSGHEKVSEEEMDLLLQAAREAGIDL